MFTLHNLTIKRKLTLIVMTASATAVMLACLALYALVVNYYRQSYRHDLTSLAEVIGHNCEAAIAFNVPEDADKILASLSARPSVIIAEIHDVQGNVFAAFHNNSSAGNGPSFSFISDHPVEDPGRYLIVTRDITLDNGVIGTIRLYDDMRHLKAVRWQMLISLLAVMAVVLAVAFFVATRLQGLISVPISDLAAVSRRISESRDYSMRARKLGEDELGHLVDVFNDMLEQIERRDSALQESENRFHTLIAQAVDAFLLHDTEGRFIDVNREACDSLGYTREELLSKTVADVEIASGPDSQQEKGWDNLAAGPVTIEARHRRKDGTTFPVEVRLGTLKLGDQTLIMRLARDISERRQLHAQFLQAQKMEAIGRLSGGVAHDFNNLLTTILGYSEIILMDLPDDSPLKESITAISYAGQKAAELTHQLLAFSRKQVLEMKVIDLNGVIENMVKILRRMIGEDVELHMHIQTESAIVMADPVQVEQVLMNLVVNARDAMPHGGRLTIETETVHLDADYSRSHQNVFPGTYIMLSVTDTGVGMSREIQEKIFEPFFTTKEKGKGTGLGLATIYGIVRQHKGHIYVYSEPGQGTSFKIYFPKVAEAVEEELQLPAKETMPRGMETILVVDDEAAIRQLVADTLQPLGYELISAASGEEALKLVNTKKKRVDLLLTDVVMPGMNGRELAEALQLQQPDVKVVFMSGYTDEVIVHKGMLEPGTRLINKPLVPSKLAVRLREILGPVKHAG